MTTASYYSVHFAPQDWPRIQPVVASMNSVAEGATEGLRLPLWTLEDGPTFSSLPAATDSHPTLSGSGRFTAANLVGSSVGPELVHPALSEAQFHRIVRQQADLQAWGTFTEDQQTTWAAFSAWQATTVAVVDLHEELTIYKVVAGQVEARHIELAGDEDAALRAAVKLVERLLESGAMASTGLADLSLPDH